MFYNCSKNILQVSNCIVKRHARFISLNKHKYKPSSYEGDGKTKANILNNEADVGLLINGVSQVGFRLNNNITVLGPMVIFPRSVLSWNISHVNDICPETLSLFTVLEPSLEIIVIGVGDKLDNRKFYQNLLPFVRKYRINLEILPTEQACSTFNFLNSEGRYVVGALIPPQILQGTEDDLLRTKLKYQNLYEVEY